MVARMPVVWPLAAMAAFVVLLALTVGGWVPLDAVDVAVSDWFRAFGASRPRVVSVVRVVTDVAATWSFLLGGLVATAVLAARGQRRAAVLIGLATALVPVLWSVMHVVLPHPRPAEGFVALDSNGFPSGHTSNAAAAALLVVLLLWSHLGRAGRAWAVAGAAGFAVCIGLTRVMLLAHWPVDVLGGWLLALAVVPALARAVDRPERD
jgi:membrane-associated phospholipid phosphatase